MLVDAGAQPSGLMTQLSWKLRPKVIDNILSLDRLVESSNYRRSGVVGRRADEQAESTSMKIELFRLMYENVKFCDAKVKKLEYKKTEYKNVKPFEIGYLFGDISDKYNVMIDISKTLTRYYSVWTPIEHVNAYEQIANLGIEIGHLVELMKSTYKMATAEGDETSKY